VLTNVSLDHVQLLGPTIEAVAGEKAGIIKAGVPVVTGEWSGKAADVFASIARAAAAPLRALSQSQIRDVSVAIDGTDLTVTGTTWGALRLHTPLAGRHQAVNAALAVHAIDNVPALRPQAHDVVEGIARVRWPGRLQVERAGDVMWIFDVAHNVAGVESLVGALTDLAFPRPIVALVGVLGDKDWRTMLVPLHAAVDHVVLTVPPTAPADRRWDPAEALSAAPSERAEIQLDFGTALEKARARARAGGGSIVVTGSFHTVGDALNALGWCPDGTDHLGRGTRYS
jgi:dihydrofolate synthase/folylpolyglutamate synthase